MNQLSDTQTKRSIDCTVKTLLSKFHQSATDKFREMSFFNKQGYQKDLKQQENDEK